MPRITAIIPALNEGPRIYKIVKKLQALPDIYQVIVADNASTDNTAEQAKSAGATLVTEMHKGYGAACLAGLTVLANNTDAVLFVNADGAEKISEAQQLIDAWQHADLVVGSRVLGQADERALLPQQRFGNALACWLINKAWGTQFSDLGPFRIIDSSLLKHLDMKDKDYGWIIEMQLKALMSDARILEIPVTTRASDEASKISGTLSGLIGASYKILSRIFFYSLCRATAWSAVPHASNHNTSSSPIRTLAGKNAHE